MAKKLSIDVFKKSMVCVSSFMSVTNKVADL